MDQRVDELGREPRGAGPQDPFLDGAGDRLGLGPFEPLAADESLRHVGLGEALDLGARAAQDVHGHVAADQGRDDAQALILTEVGPGRAGLRAALPIEDEGLGRAGVARIDEDPFRQVLHVLDRRDFGGGTIGQQAVEPGHDDAGQFLRQEAVFAPDGLGRAEDGLCDLAAIERHQASVALAHLPEGPHRAPGPFLGGGAPAGGVLAEGAVAAAFLRAAAFFTAARRPPDSMPFSSSMNSLMTLNSR